MEMLELSLLLLASVLVSAVIAQIIPRVSAPLAQIGMGLVIAFVAQGQVHITLDPELFLVLFIAPLLFNEARKTNRHELWHNRRSLLSYAIALVVVITLVVGFTLHALVPSISLACAFALGAALGPTDPIAVAAISRDTDIPERQRIHLKGESLINDASGIVSFQFAIAAAVTGTFSVLDAVGEFVVSFFGALIIGAILGFVISWAIRKVRDLGLENTTFHVLAQVFTPFIAYLLGEAIGVSGVITVVVCGIALSSGHRPLRPSISRMNIVSSNVWQVLSFTLNGIVFVLLGTQLPGAMENTWTDTGISNSTLILYVLVITAVMHGTRFLWSFVSETLHYRRIGVKQKASSNAYSALIMTLSGSKGAITLAIMFTIPMLVATDGATAPFPDRDLLIFLASGVIIVSLLLATFVVPLIAPKKVDHEIDQERDTKTKIEILRAVIQELTLRQTPSTQRATNEVIAQYTYRIEVLRDRGDLPEIKTTRLRIKALEWEEEYVQRLIDAEEVPALEGYRYINRISTVKSRLKHDRHYLISFRRWFGRTKALVTTLWRRFRLKMPGPNPDDSPAIMREIQIRTDQYIIERLQTIMPESNIPTESYSMLIADYQRTINLLKSASSSTSMETITEREETVLDISRLSLQIELEQIQQAYEEERLSRTAAAAMRENVYIMQIDLEDYV